jgi:dihydrofolate reductase
LENNKDSQTYGRDPENEAAAWQNMYAVGGAMLISSLMNLGLIDELRLLVNPLVLGGGKALFKDVKDFTYSAYIKRLYFGLNLQFVECYFQ